MSSGSRRGASEENILAMLERDATRRRMASHPRFAVYAIAGSVALSLVGALAWLLHENNNANEMLRLPEQPGVSVTVVPDKPTGAQVLASAEPGTQPAAATIIDNPEPALHKVAETQSVTKIAQAAPPASKAAVAQPAAQKAHDDVPPLVLLKPEEAASAAAGAAKKAASAKARSEAAKPAASAASPTEAVRQAAGTPALADTARRGAAVASHEPAAARGAAHDTPATRAPAPARVATAAPKKASTTRDETRRVAARQRAGEAEQPARPGRAGAQAKAAGHARAETLASATARQSPRATGQARPKKVSAAAEKREKKGEAVDTDVALISAIISHSDRRSQHRVADGDSADKKSAARP
jgi:hypothetical protein